MTDIMKPSGEGSSNDTTRKVVGGWHAIMEGRQQGKNTKEVKQARIIKEQDERVSEKAPQEGGFKPGEEDSSDGFSLRKAKQHMQKLMEQKQSQRTFQGNAQQIALKLQILTEGDPDAVLGDKVSRGGHTVKVISCESAGLGSYKLTYLLLD